MAIRIVGVDLPQNKRGEIALTYIYGILPVRGQSTKNNARTRKGKKKTVANKKKATK